MIQQELYQIQMSFATFGIVVENEKVIKSAPIAAWTVGKNKGYVLQHFSNRGAKITLIQEYEEKQDILLH